MKTKARKWLAISSAILCFAFTCHAFLRMIFSDAQVVARAELIVVGKVRDGSVRRIEARTNGNDYVYQVHHVELEVSEVLKGSTTQTSLTVCVCYGLAPITGGIYSKETRRQLPWLVPSNFPPDIIEIYDTGTSSGTTCLTGDIRTNHIWMLWHAPLGRSNYTELLAIATPEDIQPLKKREALLQLAGEDRPEFPRWRR
jgi:hypothetical protein